VVVAMGGDGTANEVANGMPPEVLMGVVPAGASSVFARQLRLPRQTLPAAAVLAAAIAERRWRPVGLGSVNGRMFTFSAGMGLEAEATRIVDERRRQRADGRRPRDSAVVAAAGRVLWSDRLSMPERITVTAGDRSLRASYLAIANQHPYSYWGRLPVRTTPRASFASALDAVVVSALRPRQLWRLPAYGLVWPRHARGRDRHVAYLHDVDPRSTSPATSRSGCSWTASTWGRWRRPLCGTTRSAEGAHPTRGGGVLPGPGPGAGSGRYVTLGRPRVGCGNSAISS
jgi:diacylglycerol kinase family enzyme